MAMTLVQSKKMDSFTADNTSERFIKYMTFAMDLFPDTNKRMISALSAKVKGFNRQFIPRLYRSVPELYMLNDQDLEDLVDESESDDLTSRE